jgi:hypothetical protein
MRRVFFTQKQIFAQKFLLLRSAIEKQFQMIEIDGLLNEIKKRPLSSPSRPSSTEP